MSFADLLIRRVTIQRRTVTETAMGEQNFTFPSIATDVPCDIQNLSGARTRQSPGEFIDGSYRFYFLPGQDVQESDKIIDEDGVDYEVRFVDCIRNRRTSGDHHLEVLAIKPHLLEE